MSDSSLNLKRKCQHWVQSRLLLVEIKNQEKDRKPLKFQHKRTILDSI